MAKFYKFSILLVTAFIVLSSALDYNILHTEPSAGIVLQDFAFDLKIVHEITDELAHKLDFDTENAVIKPEYRFHISIERGEEIVCSGAAIQYGSRQYVITAASCGVKDTDIVRVNSGKALTGGSVYQIKCVINHSNFRRPGADPYDNDIAILYIDGNFAEKTLSVGQVVMPNNAETTAYSQFSKKAFKSALIVSNVKIYSRQECENYGYELTNKMVCAGQFDVNTSFCNVDHGSPLFDQNGSLLGIKSWGEQCSRIALPAVYTKISEMFNWIDSTLRAQPQC